MRNASQILDNLLLFLETFVAYVKCEQIAHDVRSTTYARLREKEMTMCTLAAIAACFSLGGIYVDTGLDYQDVGVWRAERHDYYHKSDALIESGTSWTNTNSAQNPYGRIGLGYQMDIDFGSSKVILTLSGYHQESIVNSDRGVNGINFGARYFPFARQ